MALDPILGDGSALLNTRTSGEGPAGSLPIDADTLRDAPSGHLFGMTQNAGMGWRASEVARDPYLILSTQGGLRAADGQPVALGLHTGHWELDQMVRAAAETLAAKGGLPFAVACSDPCDGRTQGTTGMFDSLPYRNDAAMVMRRLVRSLPTRLGVLGVATCDKGLPAMMLALAGCGELPGVIVPGGVTLPARDAEDTAVVQTIGARFAHGLIDLEHAAAMGNGPVNALDQALRRALTKFYPGLKDVELLDYKVRVLSSGEGTAASVRVLIESGDGKARWGTVGVSHNVIEASWQALVDSIDYKLYKDARCRAN